MIVDFLIGLGVGGLAAIVFACICVIGAFVAWMIAGSH